MVVVKGEADLVEVALALHADGGLADLLDGGDEQADQDSDDGNHHHELDQREAGARAPGREPGPHWRASTNRGSRTRIPRDGEGAWPGLPPDSVTPLHA